MDDEQEEMKWGTWEEFLLGSAVKRHGTNNWDLVSFELQARNISPYVSSPEACKAKYDALQGRFNGCKSSDHNNNSMPWLEELRRLRVAQLKEDLQRSNDSIGSLRSKLEKLKAERAQSLKGDVQSESVRFQLGSSQPNNNGRGSEYACQRGEASDGGEPEERSKDRSSAGSFTEGVEGAETVVWKAPGHERIRNTCEMGEGDRIERAQTGADDRELNSGLEEGKRKPATVGGSLGVSPNAQLDRHDDEEKKGVESASDDGPVPLQQQVPKGQPSSPLDSFYGSSETLADEREQNRSHHDFVESKNSNIGACQDGADLAAGKDDLRSKQQRSRRPRTNNSRHVLIPQRPKAEDLDASKREENVSRAGPEGETGNAHESHPGDTICLENFAKTEPDQGSMGEMGCTEDSEMHTVDTNVSERSSEPVRRRRRRRGRRKQPKTSSFKATDVHSETSRSKHKELVRVSSMKDRGVEEGSAESMETGNKTFTGIKEESQKVAWIEGLPGDSDVLSSANPAELSTRQGGKAFSTSHEVSGSAREHFKECEDCMDNWNQTTRSSGDSHIDKAGSQMEGTEEMSPMSRRSRREPKVPGKLLPLLECLRTISSHKFGSLFKHRLESQNNQQYRSVIRRHMDLGTIRSRLEEGSYSCSLEFFRDLLLVFNNALIYYPKGSQEFGAAWVLRQLATKEMANIFQTEALLKQEGPSTRKREPRKTLDSVSVFKFNPTSVGLGRKRNARPSGVGRAVRRPKNARLNLEQSSAGVHWQTVTREQQLQRQPQVENETDETKEEKIEGYATEELKERIAASSFTPLKPKLDVESEQRSEATNVRNFRDGSRMVAEATAAKTPGNSPQPRKSSAIGIDPVKGFNSETRKIFNNAAEPRIDRGSRAMKKEHHAIPPSEPFLPPPTQEAALPATAREPPPPVKRGVGRPPKHAQRGAQKQPTPATKPGAESEAPSKPRKRARR